MYIKGREEREEGRGGGEFNSLSTGGRYMAIYGQ